ncbi:MAG TPA: PEGA domain-containing protein [Vicinamibacterales bacterium]|nr:PEGA domain-containing protein [Vicinamibacterales bacterium]
MLRVSVTQSEASGGVLRDFEDGLGRRYRSASLLGSATPLEILCFRHDLTAVPAFEFALRERLARVSEFQHPSFARSRRIDKLNDEHGTVTLVSDGAEGDRLVRILTEGDGAGPVVDVSSALHLTRQLIAAVAALHQHTHIAHGAIALERLFVTPRGQLIVVEHPLGAALEQLKYSRERYWKELRVALPMDAGLPRFDERADLVQVGMVALSLILARPIHDDEYPRQVDELVASACARATGGTSEPLPSPVRQWLRRTLQLEARNSFRSAFDAQAAFGEVVSHDAKRHGDPDGLITVVQRFPATPDPRPTQPQPPSPMPANVTTPVAGPVVRDMPSIAPLPTRETYEPLPLPQEHSTDVFDEAPETEDKEDVMISARTRTRRIKQIAAGVALLAATTVGLYAARERFSRSAAASAVATGTVTVTTDPPGADVQIDGVARGQSPLTLALAPGAHNLVVRGNGQSRTVPITIAAGAEVSQYLDMPKAGADLGQLQVRTDPPGARVSVDGTLVGTTPMTIGELLPGDHTVTFENELGSVSQKVVIEAGVPASLMVPMGMPAGTVASGWLAVTAPLVVDLQENGRLVGNSGIEKIMLPAGRHVIDLVNDTVGFRETRTVQVSPGRTSSITITLPKGTVSLNAIPWASVFIDGQSVGDTPIGNLPLTVGSHEVVFRNAELGEQRRTITVTTRSAVRLSVDLTKK